MKNKVALITGASAGIGKATAHNLLAEGMTVYVAARRVEKMQDLVAKGAIALQLDITKEEEISQAVAQINQAHGGVDVLVNNAGFGSYGAVEDTSIDDARYQFEVNIFGLARLTQLVLPHMREQKAGKIINVSSIGGKVHTPLGSWYHATKHALEGWSDCLRLEVSPYGIDVVIIEPGLIVTEFGDVVEGPLRERSGNGAYADLTNKLIKSMHSNYEEGAGSPPSVIAKVITKAVKARRPKTRYAAGKMAKQILAARKILSDRAFDKLIMRFL